MDIKYKVLCQVCHDRYGDEEFCFGVCCGKDMVKVPKDDYDKIVNDKDKINDLIKEKGKSIFE